tara:strand:+ start:88954 stop:90441 length:1488 start_codon:yes stop_codon:yes gene_type:complete
MKFILAIDQGTTGTTAALINSETLEFVDKVNKEFPQIYPSPGLVEHNLNDIWDTVKYTIKTLLSKNNINRSNILSIGITNQRETTCAFNDDGEALTNAIVWQDKRTSDFCQSLKSNEDMVKTKTGLPIDPYFSATKINWFLTHIQSVKDALSEGNLKFGTIDTFLLFKLSGNKSFKTEPSNASRTLLMDLKKTDWDDELLNLFEVPRSTLPTITDSFADFGITEGLSFLPDGIPITGILGDQQSALFGQAGHEKGSIKCTYGTGSFMLLNIGNEIQYSKNGLLTTVAYQHKGKAVYALEGSCFIAGAAVQWIRDNLNFIKDSSEIESLANSISSLDSVKNILFLPFFSGLGSPHWIPDGKAAIIGLSRDSGKAEISHACLEGIALSINDLLNAMRVDSGVNIDEIRVDGGAVVNDLLMNLQATFSGCKVIRPSVIETTAYGAALAAAIGSNTLKFEDISKLWKEDKCFEPSSNLMAYTTSKSKLWDSFINKLYIK